MKHIDLSQGGAGQGYRRFAGRPARAMRAVAATLGLAALIACGGSSGGASVGPIRVVSATYGASCGAPAGNATQDLKTKCDGQQTCDYIVDYHKFGDPKAGCAKDYSARWTCGDSPDIHDATVAAEAGFGKQVQIACAAK